MSKYKATGQLDTGIWQVLGFYPTYKQAFEELATEQGLEKYRTIEVEEVKA